MLALLKSKPGVLYQGPPGCGFDTIAAQLGPATTSIYRTGSTAQIQSFRGLHAGSQMIHALMVVIQKFVQDRHPFKIMRPFAWEAVDYKEDSARKFTSEAHRTAAWCVPMLCVTCDPVDFYLYLYCVVCRYSTASVLGLSGSCRILTIIELRDFLIGELETATGEPEDTTAEGTPCKIRVQPALHPNLLCQLLDMYSDVAKVPLSLEELLAHSVPGCLDRAPLQKAAVAKLLDDHLLPRVLQALFGSAAPGVAFLATSDLLADFVEAPRTLPQDPVLICFPSPVWKAGVCPTINCPTKPCLYL